ncbi:MAG: 4-hydroxy-tetrahydrodipicolinate synthase [Bacillota bacterium]
MEKWGRLITAMATPFTNNGELNLEASVELAKKLEKEGSTALVLAGTTGESPTLSVTEKIQLINAVKRRVSIPIIANVGSNNTAKSVEFAISAGEAGADGVMAVVPYYNKPNKAGMIAHFQSIAQATQLPVMVYNVPGRTGSNMDLDTILELAKIPHIKAVKEATHELEKMSFIIKETKGKFSVYTGEDALTLPVLAIGGYGVVSVAAHIAGKQMKAMIESYLSGNIEKAKEIHLALSPIYKNLFLTSNPIPLKAALKIVGIDAGPVRLPLIDADESIKEILKTSISDLRKLEEAN